MNSIDTDNDDSFVYRVVINHEEQYSIWPDFKDNALGWSDVGKAGTKQECLAYIKEVWTDMRPLSLRRDMEKRAMAAEPEPAELPGESDEPSLVDRLCQGEHPVKAGLRPRNTVQLFKEAINRNFTYIKFTDTRGGTELGVALDRSACDLGKADFETSNGSVHLEGDLTLDYSKVRCVADIDLSTLSGTGHLTRL
jgi:uncharacterized protein YbdZ (MbtH family)